MKNKYLFICLIFVLAGCGRVERYSGRIRVDTVWTGRIILEGDVYVEPGVKLTISPGVRVSYTKRNIKKEVQRLSTVDGATFDLFHENKIELIIAGDLDINGTSQKPVKFAFPRAGSSAVSGPSAGGISFVGLKSSSSIRHLIMTGGYVGIRVYNSRAPLLEDIIITDTKVAAIGVWNRASPKIYRAKISENKYGIGASDLATPIIENSIISNNSASGIFFEGKSWGIIRNSKITGNNVGVALGNKSNSEIINSTITGNGSGIGCWDESAPQIRGNYFDSNIIGILALNNSKPNVSNNKFIKNGGGITFTDSSSGMVKNNLFKKSGPAVLVSGRASPVIYKNRMLENEHGIRISGRAIPEVSKNVFEKNRIAALLMDFSEPKYYQNKYINNLSDKLDSRLK